MAVIKSLEISVAVVWQMYFGARFNLDRDVAVKVLRFDFQNDQTAIRRFQREALAATELVHPNIVSVYDVGEEDNMQYLVMEYVKGMDLKRYIQTHYPVPYETAVNIMQQILSAISLAHNHQIIHRDLKPQNVLIDNEGVVKSRISGLLSLYLKHRSRRRIRCWDLFIICP